MLEERRQNRLFCPSKTPSENDNNLRYVNEIQFVPCRRGGSMGATPEKNVNKLRYVNEIEFVTYTYRRGGSMGATPEKNVNKLRYVNEI